MSANDILVNRDVENDILYVIKRGYEKSRTRNILVNADVTLRIDIVNNQVVGLTIEDFSIVFPDFKDHPEYILMEHFEKIIELLNASHLALSKT